MPVEYMSAARVREREGVAANVHEWMMHFPQSATCGNVQLSTKVPRAIFLRLITNTKVKLFRVLSRRQYSFIGFFSQYIFIHAHTHTHIGIVTNRCTHIHLRTFTFTPLISIHKGGQANGEKRDRIVIKHNLKLKLAPQTISFDVSEEKR